MGTLTSGKGAGTQNATMVCMVRPTSVQLSNIVQSASIYNNIEDSGPTAWESSLNGDNLQALVANTCKHIQVYVLKTIEVI